MSRCRAARTRRIMGWSGIAVATATAGTLVAGCGNDSTPSSLDARGEEASDAAVLWWILLGAAVFVGIVIVVLIVWSALRGPRGNPGRMGDDTFIAVGGVVFPSVVLIPVAVLTVLFTTWMRPDAPDDDRDDAVAVTIVGHQYWWEIRYPELGIVTANELTVPVDRPVDLTLRSADVIHSFWVPQLAGKQDLVPGQTNRLRIEANRPGDYWGLCAEFCGEQHTNMSFVVHALDAAEFERWASEHPTARASDGAGTRTDAEPSTALARRGRAVFDGAGCAGCHTIASTDARGDVGPDLTDLAARSTLGAGVLDNTDSDLARWITETQDVKPGAEMLSFPLPRDDVEALVAYLRSDR